MPNSERPGPSDNAAVRCGRIRFSTKGAPAITEISPGMQAMLGISRGGEKWLRALKGNPTLLLPEEAEQSFAECLKTIRETGEPARFAGDLYSIDHQRLPVSGMIDKDGPPDGGQYVAILQDLRPARADKAALLRSHYVGLLKPSCEWICEIDLAAQMTQCLYSKRGYADEWIRVSLCDTLKMCIEKQVSAADQERMREFFSRALVRGREFPYSEAIDFEMTRERAGALPYRAQIIGIGGDKFLFCGFPMSSGAVSDELPNTALENLFDRKAFEQRCLRNRQSERWGPDSNLFLIAVVDGYECYSLEECDQLQQTVLSRLTRWRSGDSIVSKFAENLFVLCLHGVHGEQDQRETADRLFRNIVMALRPYGATVSIGASLCSHDLKRGFHQAYEEAHQALAAAQEAGGGRCVFYSREIHRESVRQSRLKNRTANGHIVDIVTFSNFNVLVDDVPVFFRYEKSKELLAILVDRRGGYATAASLIAVLWENEDADDRTYARLRKVVMRLKNTLRAYGVEDIVESISGKRHVVVEKVNCDLYEYLRRDKADRPRFLGSYLPEYSWGETTLGELLSGL